MQIRQPYIKSVTPLINQQQTDRVNSAQSKYAKQKLTPQNPQVHAAQSQPPFALPPAKKTGHALNLLEAKPPAPAMAINNPDYTAINPRNLNALNAYTEELNQPLQEQLSMLAGIDFYV
jgi:hypothetical protein